MLCAADVLDALRDRRLALEQLDQMQPFLGMCPDTTEEICVRWKGLSAFATQFAHRADDGDVDVLSASFDDNKIAWYSNASGNLVTLGTGCGTSIPLTLTSTPPALGTTWTLTAYGPLSPSWLFFFGDSPVTPGIPIPGSLPGCFAFTNGNLYTELQSSFGFSASMQIPIPNFAGLLGYSCAIQAFSSAPGGFISSNGIAATVSY